MGKVTKINEIKKEEPAVKATGGAIDKEVLDIMKQQDVLDAISDEKQMKRLELNLFCELLSEITDLRKQFDEFAQMISVCSTEKITAFFKQLQKNVDEETKKVEMYNKIKQSHKKPKKKPAGKA